MQNELYHYGILGQKWGIRRYQNADGTLTDAGKKRYWGNGSDYTYVGRQRYIKDLVKDYNAINGTKINSKQAVVKIDGKYYNGKGVELDPRGLEVKRLTGKTRGEIEEKQASIRITNQSNKHDIDEKPNDLMTAEEMQIANRYYQNLNMYEENGQKYANRHMSDLERAKKEAKLELSEEIKKRSKEVLAVLGGIAAAKVISVVKEKFASQEG